MITCPNCGKVSHNPNDEAHRYCGVCHQYHDTMPTDLKLMPPEVRAEMLTAFIKSFGEQASQNGAIATICKAMGADREFIQLAADAADAFSKLQKRASEMLIKQASGPQTAPNPHES